MEPEEQTELQRALELTNEYSEILRKIEKDSALTVVTYEVGDPDEDGNPIDGIGVNYIHDLEFIGNMKSWLKLKLGALSRIINQAKWDAKQIVEEGLKKAANEVMPTTPDEAWANFDKVREKMQDEAPGIGDS